MAAPGGFALALVLLAAAGPAHAASTSSAFSDAGGGPRSIALGGHLVALPVDDLALESNPARLVYGTGSASAQVDRLDPDLDLWRGRIGAAIALGGTAAEPLQATQPRRVALGVSLSGQGLRLVEGSSYRESAIAVGFAAAPVNVGSFGVVVRALRSMSDVAGAEATGFAVDVGLSLDVMDHWDVALAIQNALGRTTFEDSDDEDRAARVTIGLAAARHRRWQGEIDLAYEHNTIGAIAGGIEAHVVPGVLDLRAGVSREMIGVARVVPSFGLGLTAAALHFDYAFRSDPDGAFETQHRVALGARF